MKVLIGHEFSAVIREAFRAAGHDAMSCDLLPSEQPGPHYQGDVFDVIDYPWDLAIFHPPCTHTAVSGARHFEAKRIKCSPVISFGPETAELQTVEEIVAKALNPEEPK